MDIHATYSEQFYRIYKREGTASISHRREAYCTCLRHAYTILIYEEIDRSEKSYDRGQQPAYMSTYTGENRDI